MDFSLFWNEFLVRPVFNVLVYIYNNMSEENLGVAVILLTIGLRIALLPFSVLTILGKSKAEMLQRKMKDIARDFKGDRVAIKQELRRLLKQHKLHPWAKAVSLGVQGLVLLLLYQVFARGLRGEVVVHQLYDWNDYPARINTDFAGFDLAATNWYWAVAVGVLLFFEIYAVNKRRKKVTPSDMWFNILFPLASCLVLAMLPMAKSLFILTSMAFSAILMLAQRAFANAKNSLIA